CLLLRTGCEWPPRGSATQKCDEIPSPHGFAHARTTSDKKDITPLLQCSREAQSRISVPNIENGVARHAAQPALVKRGCPLWVISGHWGVQSQRLAALVARILAQRNSWRRSGFSVRH